MLSDKPRCEAYAKAIKQASPFIKDKVGHTHLLEWLITDEDCIGRWLWNWNIVLSLC